MEGENKLEYILHDPVELNLSYMPFISGGGLFVPSEKTYSLGEKISVAISFPGQSEVINIEGKVIWITPKNALHHVIAGVGIQFIGQNSQEIKNKIESYLDKKIEVGGYTYGISGEDK